MDVGDDAAAGDRRLDQHVQLLVPPGQGATGSPQETQDNSAEVPGHKRRFAAPWHLMASWRWRGEIRRVFRSFAALPASSRIWGFARIYPHIFFKDFTALEVRISAHLCRQVLEDGGGVDGGGAAHPAHRLHLERKERKRGVKERGRGEERPFSCRPPPSSGRCTGTPPSPSGDGAPWTEKDKRNI